MEAGTKKYPLWSHLLINLVAGIIMIGWVGVGFFMGLLVLNELGWLALYRFVDPYLQEHLQLVGVCKG